jgi:FkbM family methyltransferase
MQYLELPSHQRLVFARHGTMLVNLHDHYIGGAIATYGEYSQLETEFILDWMPAGRDVVEVGANIGSISLPIAKKLAGTARRLMAIEPQPVIFQHLCANLALNHARNVVTINQACSPVRGTLYFARQDYDQSGNFGAVRLREHASAGDERVDAVPLDELTDTSWDVGLLKIDVEGMESAVLRGAGQLIARCRPVIYLENDQPAKSKALIEQIWAMGYRIWFHTPTLFNPNNFAGQADNLYPTVVSINMLCLPQEHSYAPDTPALQDAVWHPLQTKN